MVPVASIVTSMFPRSTAAVFTSGVSALLFPSEFVKTMRPTATAATTNTTAPTIAIIFHFPNPNMETSS